MDFPSQKDDYLELKINTALLNNSPRKALLKIA